VAFSPDGAVLATASNDRAARIWDTIAGWDTPVGRERIVLTGHKSPVTGVAFSPDGALLVTVSYDRTVRIWDTASGANLATLLAFDGGSAVLLPDGAYKLAGDPRGALWWVIKLCRFEPGELDPYIDSIKKLPGYAKILS
jgi:WD40 repeat protein